MTLDRFKVFTAVAKHHNATRASEELHISQPAVTKQLKALEKAYNAKLYQRTGRGTELTEIGRVFLRDITKILAQYGKLRQKFSAVSPAAKIETLTVGGSFSLAASLLPSLLADFRKSRPNVEINLRADNGAAIERLVLTSDVDIAVINNAASNHLLTTEPYGHEPLVAFTSTSHPLVKKQKVIWQDLKRTPFIIRTPARGGSATEQLLLSMSEKGLRPNVAMRCGSPEAVKAAVKQKLGVGILFKKTIEPELRRGEFKIIKLPMKTVNGDSALVYRKDKSLSAAAQAFLNFLRQRQQGSVGDQRNHTH